MRRVRLVLLWLLFALGLAGSTYLGLDTLGYLPHQAPRLDKIADIDAVPTAATEGRKRIYLIKRKMAVASRLRTFGGSETRAKQARQALEQGIDLFAKKKYAAAEQEFKRAMAALTKRDYRPTPRPTSPQATATATEPTAMPTEPTPTLAANVQASLEKKLEVLETRLGAITDPTIDTDEAWLMMDRAFNSIRAGKVKDAKYFLTEASIKIDNLE